jgi:hypothetical protein
MLRDVERNEKFAAAIRKAIMHRINNGGIHTSRASDEILQVLDIGTGSGLLANIAASADEHVRVTACEMEPVLAEVAEETVKENQNTSQVSVYAKHSSELLPEDMFKPADVVVFELFDDLLLGEGVVPALRLARDQGLLEKDCSFVPHAATIYACAVDSVLLQVPPPKYLFALSIFCPYLESRPLVSPAMLFVFACMKHFVSYSYSLQHLCCSRGSILTKVLKVSVTKLTMALSSNAEGPRVLKCPFFLRAPCSAIT